MKTTQKNLKIYSSKRVLIQKTPILVKSSMSSSFCIYSCFGLLPRVSFPLALPSTMLMNVYPSHTCGKKLQFNKTQFCHEKDHSMGVVRMQKNMSNMLYSIHCNYRDVHKGLRNKNVNDFFSTDKVQNLYTHKQICMFQILREKKMGK